MPAPRVIASQIGFTEGPVWTSSGLLLVTSISRGLVYEIDLGRGVVGQVETGGGPNGLALDADGGVWVAQNGGSVMPTRSARPVSPGLQRIAGGVVEDVVTRGLVAPNDLVQGPDGRIWFTDPGAQPGRVLAYDPRTGDMETVADGVDYPNGLVFDAAGEVLYLAETRTGRILHYRRDGTALQTMGVFATLPEGGPDGLAFDVDGNLYAAAPEADMIAVFAPDGSAGSHIRFDGPTFPTNLCFAGPELATLVVTAAKGGRVLGTEAVAQGCRASPGPRPSG